MSSRITLRSSLLAGIVAGALVLGLAGRAAMALVALITGSPLNLSARGVVEAVVVGALLGAVGGLLLAASGRAGAGSASRGLAVGAVLFAESLLVGWIGGRLAGPSQTRTLALAVLAIVYLAYGACAASLLARLGHDRA